MSVKFLQFVLLAALATASSLAGARMLTEPIRAEAPIKGIGMINEIVASKNLMTINGMTFSYHASRTRVIGASASNLKAGQRVEYTATPEGTTQRITEIRPLPTLDDSVKSE